MSIHKFRTQSLCICLFFVLIAYGWHTGKMIHTDDFSRIQDNSSLDADYFRRLIFDNKSDGFYRPLNHLTFGLTYFYFGVDAKAYGYFNLAVLLGTCLILHRVVERITNSAVFASLTVFGWLLNFKLVSAALLWGVGRCDGLYALLVLLAMLLSLKALDSQRCYWHLSLSVLSAFLAMLAKESAIVGPVLVGLAFLVVGIRSHRFRPMPLAYLGFCMAFAITAYLSLRNISCAMKPGSAPSYYRLSPSFPVVINHIRFYIERSMVLSGLIVPALAVAYMVVPAHDRKRLRNCWVRVAMTIIVGMCLFIVAAAPILFLPRWGDLYGYFPSMFIVGTMTALLSQTRLWPRRRSDLSVLLFSMVVLALAVMPVVLEKGRREVEENKYVYDWCRSVKVQTPATNVTRIVIMHKATEWKKAGLSDVDFDYFQMGVGLMLKMPIIVLQEDRQASCNSDADSAVFEFISQSREGHFPPDDSSRGNWRLVCGVAP